MGDEDSIKLVAENRKARFNYELIERFEAGIVLTGGEIKSVRGGNISIAESFVRPIDGEIYLIGATIQPYKFVTDRLYEPTRRRKLLLHRREIDLLNGGVSRKGLTIVPLRVYLKRGRAKIEIALARGKSAPDKREAIKEREGKRELARVLKRG